MERATAPDSLQRLERLGRLLLAGLLAGGTIAIVWTGASAPEWLWVVPVSGVGVLGLFLLAGARPKLGRTGARGSGGYLGAVLGFVLIASFDPGIQATEVLYALFLFGYLALWFARRWTTGERLVWTVADGGVAVFVGWSLVSVLWAPLTGARVSAAASEAMMVLLLLLYFPTREVVAHHRRGPALVLVAITALGAYATVRNLLNYRSIIVNAVFEWQTNIGRVTTNEMLLVAAALVLMAVAVSISGPWRRGSAVAALAATLAALVITQSRAFWLDFLLGAVVMTAAFAGAPRRRIIGLMALGTAMMLGLGLLLFPSAIEGIASGVAARFQSIGSAASRDISLRSRLYEASAALDLIRVNPILGYGLAAQYSFYDIIADATVTRSFVHNGYVDLLLKGGLIGFSAMLAAWGGMLAQAYRAWRAHRMGALGPAAVVALAGLVALFPSSSTSIHFYVGDTLLTMALLGGLAAGLSRRASEREPRHDERATGRQGPAERADAA